MENAASWNGNWAWSLPLIMLSVIFHVIGLGFINVKMIQVLSIAKEHRYFVYVFALVMGITTILATLLHGIEAGIWAAAYRVLGALPDNKSALLYSLSAITTYGHSEVYSGQPLAAHGRAGSFERHHPDRPDHGLYVRHDSAGLADRGARMARAPVMVETKERVEIKCPSSSPAWLRGR